jgi:hypothetical protein
LKEHVASIIIFEEELFATCFQITFLLGLYFSPEDEGDKFLQKFA